MTRIKFDNGTKGSSHEDENIHKVPSTSKTIPSNLGAWLSGFILGLRAANRRGSRARLGLMTVNVRVDEDQNCDVGRQTACKIVGRKTLCTDINGHNQYVRQYVRVQLWWVEKTRWPSANGRASRSWTSIINPRDSTIRLFPD
jgi:hypothetical protein